MELVFLLCAMVAFFVNLWCFRLTFVVKSLLLWMLVNVAKKGVAARDGYWEA